MFSVYTPSYPLISGKVTITTVWCPTNVLIQVGNEEQVTLITEGFLTVNDDPINSQCFNTKSMLLQHVHDTPNMPITFQQVWDVPTCTWFFFGTIPWFISNFVLLRILNQNVHRTVKVSDSSITGVTLFLTWIFYLLLLHLCSRHLPYQGHLVSGWHSQHPHQTAKTLFPWKHHFAYNTSAIQFPKGHPITYSNQF